MPNKPSGFVTTFKWLGQLRAMVSCNGHCEDFAVTGDPKWDLSCIWEQVLEQSELLRGLNLSSHIEEDDRVILFTVEGYSDAHAELVSQLRSEVSDASTELDNCCRAILDSPVERVNVAIEAHEISMMLRRRADAIAKFVEADNPASDSAKTPDPVQEMQLQDDGGPAVEVFQ